MAKEDIEQIDVEKIKREIKQWNLKYNPVIGGVCSYKDDMEHPENRCASCKTRLHCEYLEEQYYNSKKNKKRRNNEGLNK